MPLPVLLLVIAALLPLAGCVTLLVIGRRLGTPLAGYLATFFIALSFLCSGWAMLRWLGGGNYQGQPFGVHAAALNVSWKWLPIGTPSSPNGFEQDHPGWLDMSLFVDSLAASLFVTVTLTAMIVHLFAVRSLRRDPRFVRFFCCLSLACFATLAVFLSGSLLQLILFLELLGFAASLLVAFRSDRPEAAAAGSKIFLVNRLGDVGLLLGAGILVRYVGNLSLPDLWLMLGGAAEYHRVVLPDGSVIPPATLTCAGIALFLGGAARCAQFPFQVWAADAAEGVAPAGAVVFSITLCVAGMFLLARVFPLFTPSARLFVAITGTTTLAMGALVATAQADIKKVLAFIAASQLGYMVLGLGVGSWAGAMFHLVAYGFFQVLLFLAAGGVIRAARGETHLSQFGGLARRMPVTAVASAVGALAACGAGWGSVGLSGYFSRSVILHHAAAFAVATAGAGRSSAYGALFVIPMAATLLTAFCMTRWWMLTFAGPPRDRRLHEHAREVATLFWPLVVLAIMTMLAGNWLGVRDMLESSVVECRQAVAIQAQGGQSYHGATVHAFDAIWPAGEGFDDEDRRDEAAPPLATPEARALDRGGQILRRLGWPLVAAGLLAGLIVYLPGDAITRRLRHVPPLNWIHDWLSERMYFDDLYSTLVVNLARSVAQQLAAFDRAVFSRGFNPPAPPAPAEPGA